MGVDCVGEVEYLRSTARRDRFRSSTSTGSEPVSSDTGRGPITVIACAQLLWVSRDYSNAPAYVITLLSGLVARCGAQGGGCCAGNQLYS